MPAQSVTAEVATLRRDGIVPLAGLSERQATDVLDSLRAEHRYAGHVERQRSPYAGGEVACWSMEAVLRAPHLFEWALGYTALAAEYLERPPLLYSLNAFETFPSRAPVNPDIQAFHHDRDDTRFVALFVYLTDVSTEADGPHQFKRGTHLGLGNRGLTEVYGPRGTAFLEDGRGQHRGLRPLAHSRVIAWARWGVTDPPASYVWDHMQPVSRDVLGARYPSDPAARASIRLVVQ